VESPRAAFHIVPASEELRAVDGFDQRRAGLFEKFPGF
jgi:hypothetical protein